MRRHLAALGAFAALALALPAPASGHGRAAEPLRLALRPGHPADIIVGTKFGTLVSHDAGRSYAWLCEEATSSISMDPAWLWQPDGTVLVTTYHGIQVSQGNLCAWATAPGTENHHAVDIERHPKDATVVVAALYDRVQPGRIVRSRNGGRSFPETIYTARDGWVTTLRHGAGHSGRLYAVRAAQDGNAAFLLSSSDGGKAWQEYPLRFEKVYSFRVVGTDPASPDVVYVVAAPSFLLRSADGGRSFSLVHETGGFIAGFVAARDGRRVWVGDIEDGVHLSEDSGKSFKLLPGSPRSACLAGDGATIYSCADRARDGYVVGRSTDGRTFSPFLAWWDPITGALPCAAGTLATEHENCARGWPAVKEWLKNPYDAGPAPAAAARSEEASATRPSGCRGCRVGAAEPAETPGLALVALALASCLAGRRILGGTRRRERCRVRTGAR